MTRRVQIKRLEIDLRGMDPKVAEAATRKLGPALERALARRRGDFESARHMNAGGIDAAGVGARGMEAAGSGAGRIEAGGMGAGGIAPSDQSRDVASRLAQQIAQRVRRS